MLRSEALGAIPEETAEVAWAALPKGNVAMWLRDELGGLYRDADFADRYATEGQPGIAPWRLAVVTVLQFAEGLTDRQAAEAVRVRLDWKYALGLTLRDQGFDYSVLSEFRERLVADQQEGRLLDPLLRRCQERGWLRGGGRARTDSSHVVAAIRALNRVQVVGETLRHALGALASVAPDWLRTHLPATYAERYGRRLDVGRLPRQPAAQDALASQIGADGAALLAALGASDAPGGVAMLPAVVTLRLVWLQQYYAPDDDGRLRWRTAADLPPAGVAIHSPYDVEARYSHKRETVWVGYKDHFTESCDPERPHLITHVATTPGTTADNDVTDQIHRDLAAKQLTPKEHLVDEGYTDAALLVSSQEHGITLVGPVREDHSRQAREQAGYDLTRFTIRWQNQQVVCPNGRTSVAWSSAVNTDEEPVIRVTFARADCRACPVRAHCTTAKDGPRRLTLRPQPEHEALHAARQHQATAAFQTAYTSRAGVEGTIAQAVGAGGARHARYRGLAKTHFQAVATAVAINLQRLWDWQHNPAPFLPHRSPLTSVWQTTTPATC